MKKLILTLSSIALLFASSAIFTSCSEHDIWADGCPYTWGVTDNQMLYCPDKTMTAEEYKDKLCGRVWRWVEVRDINSDLIGYSERRLLDEMVGPRSYIYFTENECIDFAPNLVHPFPEARYLYTKALVSYDGNMVSCPEMMSVIMGMRKDGRLEITYTQPHYAINDDGERIDDDHPSYYEYTYRVYELCDNIDIDEVMAKGVTPEELNQMIREYDNQQ